MSALEPKQLQSILESTLFANEKPLSVSEVKKMLEVEDVTTSEIEKALAALKESYDSSDRGITLVKVAGGYSLRTKTDNQIYLKRLLKAKTFRLSGPALEVLSIVAYRQPCLRLDIDNVRGVESSHVLRLLLQKGLISFAGKSDLPGKPMTYATTRKFLEVFGLNSLDDLPSWAEVEELVPAESLKEEPATLEKLAAKLSAGSVSGSYSQAEEELESIVESLAGVKTKPEVLEEESIELEEFTEVTEIVEEEDQEDQEVTQLL